MNSKISDTATKLALLAGLFVASGAHAQAVVEKSQATIAERTYQILDKDLLKVSFEEGKATVSNASLTSIADFVKATNAESKVDRYLVAAWADKDFPAKGELSKAQRELAASRADHVKKALEAAGASKIDTFEMTKQPNWIQRAFGTETAAIKDKGPSVTASEKLLKEIGQRLRDSGGPRSVVVVAKFENEVLSH